MVVGDHHHRGVERVGTAVERRDRFAVAGAAHPQRPPDFRGVEDVQRPSPVEGQVVGHVHQGADGPEPDGPQPPPHPGRRGPVADAAHEAQREGGREVRVVGREVERHRHGAREGARHRGRRLRPEPPQARGREVARDAVDARRVRPVGGEADVDDGIVEPGPGRVGPAHGRVLGQVDDAVVLVRQLKLGFRAQHAVRRDAADHARAQRDGLAGNVGARRRKDRPHAGAGVGGAAHDLHGRATARVDAANAKPVGIGMRHGLDHARDREAREPRPGVVHAFDLEPDPRQRVDDLAERRVRVEVVLEPGEGEFHGCVAMMESMSALFREKPGHKQGAVPRSTGPKSVHGASCLTDEVECFLSRTPGCRIRVIVGQDPCPLEFDKSSTDLLENRGRTLLSRQAVENLARRHVVDGTVHRCHDLPVGGETSGCRRFSTRTARIRRGTTRNRPC